MKVFTRTGAEIFRRRETIRLTNPLASLRMAGLVGAIVLWLALSAGATTYYVSSSSGNDANSGTSLSTAWKTIAHVNGQTFQPGDSVLFRRGDVWNESLVPPSSGTSGNPIAFDAYGTGAAPNLTGYYAVPSTTWVLVSGNAWKAPVPSTFTTINFCLFGSVWGQKVPAVSSNLVAAGNFYLANGFLYIFSTENPGSFYNEPIVPMALSNVPVININGKTWLTFQHFLVNWFDDTGVLVQGASDHLVFANLEADSMIPQGTQPLGFYVTETAPGPSDVKIYNSEAHLNYDAFRFDGVATAISMVNDKAYGNRDGALVDNTGAVTFSYCHFYASSLAVAGSTDVEFTSGTGPIAGAGNIAADTPPAVQIYQRYPAEITLTVDDEGMTPGADTYYASQVLPIADAAGVPVGAAITVGYSGTITPIIPEIQGWVNAGRDVASHSVSHTYYTNTDALEIQYTGSGTAATLNIANKTLTITVTDASDSVSYNLAQGQAEGTIKTLRLALIATGKFTATEIPTCQGPYGTGCSSYTETALLAQDLADVSGQDVRSAVYHMQLDVTRLTSDEITLSRQWMTANLTGLASTPVYVYPGGYETTAMQGITEGVPYVGARGALKEDLGVKDTYADGFNVQNITSFGVNPSWMGLPPASLNQKIQALVWKESVWGVPWGIFWHLNELTNSDPVGGAEITNLIQDFKNSGATIRTNTGLVNWLLAGTQEAGTDGNDYYTIPANSMTLDFRPTKNSPVVDAGENLGATYALDINGVNQNNYGTGWEIGAHVYEGYAAYGGNAGRSYSTVGAGGLPPLGQINLPQIWVNNHEGDSLFSYELTLPGTWVTGPAPGCTFNAPYWTGAPTGAGLQAAVNDIEACRTATGVGIVLDIPPALYGATSLNGLVIPQTNGLPSSSFLILRSTQDANLPDGQIVCAHGMQDNLATSTDIGLNNPDCSGQNMYYALGPQVVGGVITGITTLSTNTTTLAPISSPGSQCVALANGYVAPGVSEVVDVGANQESVVTMSAANQTGMCGTFLKTHAAGIAVSYNVGSFTLANGSTAATAAYNDAQYMWTIEAQSTGNASAMTMCNASGTGSAPSCGSNIGPDHWLIEDMDAELYPGNQGTNFVLTMAGSQIASAIGQMATHIHFRKDFVHGDWTSTLTGANNVSGGVTFDAIYGSMVDSQISEILHPGTECHGLSAQGDQLKIDHNHIEGCSISIFSGGFGASSPSVVTATGYVPLCDTEIRRNELSFPFSWLGQGMISGNPNFGGFSMVRKNGYENKEGCRVVLAGNIIENVDPSGGQSGDAAAFDVRHGSSGYGDANYQAVLSDYTIANNIFRNNNSGIIFQNSGGTVGFGAAYHARNILFSNNLSYNANGAQYGSVSGSGMEINGNGESWQGNVTVSTDGSHTVFVAICSVDLANCPGQIGSVSASGGNCVSGGTITFPTPSLAGGNEAAATVSCAGSSYVVVVTNNGSGYTSALSPTFACAGVGCSNPTLTVNVLSTAQALGTLGTVSGFSITSNVLTVNTSAQALQAGNTVVIVGLSSAVGSLLDGSAFTITSATANTFTTPYVHANVSLTTDAGVFNSAGFQALDIAVGDPVAITQCVNSAFNTVGTSTHGTSPNQSYYPSSIGPPASGGSAAWNPAVGFQALNVTVTAPFSNYQLANTVPSGAETSGYCKLTNLQGGPGSNFQFTHNTYISNATHSLTSSNNYNNGLTDGPNYQQLALHQNEIFAGGVNGWDNNPIGTGTPTEQFDFDTANTFTADHLVWPGQTASLYTAYGGNPAFPVDAPTMDFPSTSYCTGPTTTAYTGPGTGCVGFVGAMSTTSMLLTASDYHQFELRTDSSFYAGNVADASDGTSMGVNITAIDAAQIQNLYVCGTACGLTGPYPDSPLPVVSPTLFGLDFYAGTPYPAIPFGSERLWDTNTRWQIMNPTAGVYSFANLDPFLQNARTNGLADVLLTLGATPNFISSDPTNAGCEYSSVALGSCGVPRDIAASCTNTNGLNNCDGKTDGTDQTWRNYIYALGTHVAGLSGSYQPITGVEIWNEFTAYDGTYAAWEGTDSQLARLYADANCVLTGRGAGCSAASMGVAAVGVLPSVLVLTPNSVVTQAPQSTNFGLYLQTTGALSNVDAVAVHTYPGGVGPVDGDAEARLFSAANGLLLAAGSSCSTLPCWSTEFSWGTNATQEPDPDLQAAFVARSYLTGWSAGFERMYWYAYNANNTGTLWNPNGTGGCTVSSGCLSEAGVAYGTVYGGMVGKTVSCSNASGTTWICVLASPGANQSGLVIWDTSQTCSLGVCSGLPVAIGPGTYKSYTSLNGLTTPLSASAATVLVGAKPILLNRSGN